MKFELSDYMRELSDEEILADIISVANNIGTDYISISGIK